MRCSHPGEDLMSLRSRILTTATVAAVSATLALTATTTPASAKPAAAKAAPSAERKVLDASALAPFQVAVRGGTVWWTDGAKGVITRLRNGHKTVVAHTAADGVAVSGNKLAYSVTGESKGKPFSRLVIRRPGHTAKVVNLRHFEATHNPDGKVHYGILKNYSTCAADFFNSQQPGSARYTGIVDSHPYQLEALPNGAWAVAEAAGNEILRVSRSGHVSVV